MASGASCQAPEDEHLRAGPDSALEAPVIPVRLNLRNFMCYTDVHEPLEFDGIRVACLAGANGNGKSALLDAMTWALWGKARTNRADDLMHQSPSATDMEVEFEFRLCDAKYRVLRKRSRRGGEGRML